MPSRREGLPPSSPPPPLSRSASRTCRCRQEERSAAVEAVDLSRQARSCRNQIGGSPGGYRGRTGPSVGRRATAAGAEPVVTPSTAHALRHEHSPRRTRGSPCGPGGRAAPRSAPAACAQSGDEPDLFAEDSLPWPRPIRLIPQHVRVVRSLPAEDRVAARTGQEAHQPPAAIEVASSLGSGCQAP